MEFLELAKSRYSVRKFSDQKVERQKLDRILEAGRIAPTAVNYQPQRVLVIEEEKALAKLEACTPYHFNAPLVLLVCYDSVTSWKNREGRDIGEVDASIVTAHMMFEAQELGLGSTWVGVFSSDALRKNFHMPDYLVPVALLPLGYPAEDCAPHPMHGQRLERSATVFYNSYEGVKPGEDHRKR